MSDIANKKRVEIKEALAKLMATENITVEHASVPTAAFDVVNRKLYIPLWKDISEDVYTLLISHEVGHALYTPGDDWKNKVIEGKDKNYKSVVNIVEDVRIEKLIQDKYPGARRSFRAGYAELEQQNLFGTRTSDKKIEEYGILDRINMHYKVGHYGYANVPFRPEEQPWLPRIEACKTFDDVLKLSEELLKFAEQQPEYQQQPGDSEEETEIEAGSKEEAEALKKFLESGQANPSDGSGKGKKISVTYPGDVEAREGQKSESKDGKESDGEEKPGQGKPKNKVKIRSLTQDFFDNKMKEFIDLKNRVTTVNIPEYNLKKVIVDYKKVLQQLKSYYGGNDLQIAKAKEYLSGFKGNNKHIVNQLVNLFEMKKRAKSDSRALVSKTGVLDTNKVHGYRFNEDIFRKVTTVPNGKNHGLVVFIDMSGSMGSHMAGTYAQMINIAMFCRKVNIPFEVYGFSDNYNSHSTSHGHNGNNGEKKSGNVYLEGNFSLRNYLSNRMSMSEYNEMLEYLMCVISHYSGVRGSNTYEYFQCGLPACECLGGTPLNETIISAMQIVPEFKSRYNIDIVHTVIITDGDGTSGLDYYNVNHNNNHEVFEDNIGSHGGEVYCRHHGSRKMWNLTRDDKRSQGRNRYSTRDFTANLIEMYKDITGAKMIGFYICDKHSAQYTIENMSYGETPEVIQKLKTQFEDKQFAEVQKDGYDTYYIIPAGKELLTSGEDIDFGDTNSKSIIQRKFLKAMSKKKNSRILLGRFIDHIA